MRCAALVKLALSPKRVVLLLAFLAFPTISFSNGYAGADGNRGPWFDGVGPEHDRVAVDVIVGTIKPPLLKDSSESRIDQSRLSQSRRLVFTILTKNMRLSDRIVEAHIKAKLSEDWHFAEWTSVSILASDIRIRTFDDATSQSSVPSDGINRGIQSLTKVGTANVLPLLHDNLAEFVLSKWTRSGDVSGSYTVDVTLQYNGITGWVKTTDLFIGQGDSVQIRRARTIFPQTAAEGQLDIQMPYVLRRLRANVVDPLLTEEDRASYTFVDGSVGSNGGFVKAGLETPFTSSSLDLADETSLSISALFLEDKPLKIYLPGSDPNTNSASCIFSANAEDLAGFSLWVTEEPSDRIAPSDDNGRLLYLLMTNDDNGRPTRVDPNLIKPVNDGSTIEVRQINVNNGPTGERLSAVLGDDCAQDISN